jgi:hypothetical protein
MVLIPHPRFQSIIELFDEKDHELAERPSDSNTEKQPNNERLAAPEDLGGVMIHGLDSFRL